MNIGSGFGGKTDNGKDYISIALDKSILALFPFLKSVKFTLWFVPADERKSDKSPNWTLSMREPMEKKETAQNAGQEQLVNDEEIPF